MGKIKLKDVKTLTLYHGRKTVGGGRTEPVDQLQCTAGDACDYADIEVMQCQQQDNQQWKCTATHDDTVRLGQTEVVCEGYANSQDPVYVLDGSCACEYSLHLTASGRQYYNLQGQQYGKLKSVDEAVNVVKSSDWSLWLMIAFMAYFVYQWFIAARAGNRNGAATAPPPYRGNGGGGGGGNDGSQQPPPPYDSHQFQSPKQGTSTSENGNNYHPSGAGLNNGWGSNAFWRGLGLGAAGAYALGRSGSTAQRREPQIQQSTSWFGGGIGRARSAERSSNSSSSYTASRPAPQQSSSSGFGGTRRR